jgi:hypothetical protein
MPDIIRACDILSRLFSLDPCLSEKCWAVGTWPQTPTAVWGLKIARDFCFRE